ncbi:MAG: epoxide hydrolase N-terminal domain-containing protein, partial [Pseudomonadota bacterium]|nr:epoxide hydrolase N-terminal domain-containing protein [Pseudomonadota bacterium]
MPDIQPFQIDIAASKLDSIRRRVADYQWHAAPEGLGDWQLGMSTPVLKDIQDHWLTAFDWRAAEARLNQHPQFIAEIAGLPLPSDGRHFDGMSLWPLLSNADSKLEAHKTLFHPACG